MLIQTQMMHVKTEIHMIIANTIQSKLKYAPKQSSDDKQNKLELKTFTNTNIDKQMMFEIRKL